MVDTVWPVDAVAGAPSYTGRKLRQALASLKSGATPTRPLGARSGVRPGTSQTVVTSTPTVWTCGPFAGEIDGETAAEAGSYEFAFDANATGAVTAASGAGARIDIIYVQLDDPAESDGSSVPAATRKYLAGTPASGVPPTTPARSLVIGWINVPISGGGSPTVTFKAPYTVAAGGILPCGSSAEYPATPYIGQLVDDLALGYPLRWSGSAWVGLTPLNIGQTAIVPSSAVVGGVGSVAVAARGKVTLTGAGTSISTNGLTGYDNIVGIIDVSSTAASTLTGRGRTAVPADDATANYDVSPAATGGTSWPFGVSAQRHVIEMLFTGLNAAAQTVLMIKQQDINVAGTSATSFYGLSHRAATALAGLTILTTQPLTGTERWYGWNNNT